MRKRERERRAKGEGNNAERENCFWGMGSGVRITAQSG
jgi:hypothetical protein